MFRQKYLSSSWNCSQRRRRRRQPCQTTTSSREELLKQQQQRYHHHSNCCFHHYFLVGLIVFCFCQSWSSSSCYNNNFHAVTVEAFQIQSPTTTKVSSRIIAIPQQNNIIMTTSQQQNQQQQQQQQQQQHYHNNYNNNQRLLLRRQMTTIANNNNNNNEDNDNNNNDNIEEIANNWIKGFSTALSTGNVEVALNHFYSSSNNNNNDNDDDNNKIDRIRQKEKESLFTSAADCFWRDMVSYTWNICTMEGKQSILNGLTTTIQSGTTKGTIWSLSKTIPIPPKVVIESTNNDNNNNNNNEKEEKQEEENNRKILEFWCDITTKVGIGLAHVRLVLIDDDDKEMEENNNNNNYYYPKAYTVLTVLTELKDRPYAIGKNRIRGQIHGPIKGRKYWNEQLEEQHQRDKLQKSILLKQQQQQRQQQQQQDEKEKKENKEQEKSLLMNDNDDTTITTTTTSNNNNNNNNNDDDDDDDNNNNNIPYWYVIIVGGGQGGMSIGARLQLLDIPYIIFESGKTPGSAWNNRYPSLHLHDPCWYNHLPYIEFPKSWPILCPRNKVADFMLSYSKLMDLNIITNTKVLSAIRKKKKKKKNNTNTNNNNDNDNDNMIWEVEIETTIELRKDEEDEDESNNNNNNINDSTTTKTTTTTTTTTTTIITKKVKTKVHSTHVIFATGNSSRPRIPYISGSKNKFNGIQLHSSSYKGGRSYKNKRIVVIGSNNSAFDICQDIWEQGAKSVTMIQRSPSLIVSTNAVLTLGLGPLYNENPIVHHEIADFIATTTPYKLQLNKWKQITKQFNIMDKQLHDGIKNAGYQIDYGPNDTGLFAKSATQGGGFYINVGCAELFMSGDVKLEYATINRFERNSIIINPLPKQQEQQQQQELEDEKAENSNSKDNNEKVEKVEKEIKADVIIYATGFETLDSWVSEVCGINITNQIGRTWGLGWNQTKYDPGPWEGELRNMWKPTTINGLWFQGGNLAQCRHYSQFLALQLAARYIGLHTPVYGIPKPTPPVVVSVSESESESVSSDSVSSVSSSVSSS